MNLSADPEIVLPRAGDVYTQFGIRLVIGQVTPAEITLCARYGSYTGPVRQIPVEQFQEFVAKGLVKEAS
jgi:hypothetical protein